jgi:hypothetical protein
MKRLETILAFRGFYAQAANLLAVNIVSVSELTAWARRIRASQKRKNRCDITGTFSEVQAIVATVSSRSEKLKLTIYCSTD